MIEEHDSSQEHHSKELKEQLEQLKHERDDVSRSNCMLVPIMACLFVVRSLHFLLNDGILDALE